MYAIRARKCEVVFTNDLETAENLAEELAWIHGYVDISKGSKHIKTFYMLPDQSTVKSFYS